MKNDTLRSIKAIANTHILQKEKKEHPQKEKKKYRWLRRTGRVVAVVLLLFVLLVVFIRSPWGQDIIVQKAVSYVSDKTKTKVAIEKLFITFDGDIMLKGLYLEDTKGDTLVYSKSLEADVPLWAMIRGNGVGVESLDWQGVKAKVLRKDTLNGYNFQFLIDAFVTEEPATTSADTTSAPMEIRIGDVRLKDFDIVYKDDVLGIDSHFIVGDLEIEMEKTDLDAMDFRASELTISDSKIQYYQSPVPLDPNAEPLPLPYLSGENISLNNVYIDYASYGDRIAAQLEIDELFLELPKAAIAANDIEIGEFLLKNSNIQVQTETETNAITQKVEEGIEEVKQDIAQFEWPDFRIAIEEIDFQNNTLAYRVGNAAVKKGVFNQNAIVLDNLNLQAETIFLKDKSAGLHLDEMTFVEGSGFILKEATVEAAVTDTDLSLEALSLAINNNSLNGKLQLTYPSLSELISAPEASKIAVDISSFQADLKEVFQFQPDLRSNEYLQALSKKYVNGRLTASGYLTSVKIPQAIVRWGTSTSIRASGSIQNATDPGTIAFNFPSYTAITKRIDLLQFVDETEMGITLPEDVELKGSLAGTPSKLKTSTKITTTQGTATIDGSFTSDNEIAFQLDGVVENFQLNTLLNNEQLGTLSVKIDTQGKGADINSLDATLKATVLEFQYNGYEIKDLTLDGEIKEGRGMVTSAYKDENLNLDLKANVVLDSVAPEVSLNLDLIGANLRSLGVMQRDVRTGLKLNADFKGNADDFDVIATIGDGVVVYDNKTYLLGDVATTAHVRKDTTSVWLDNKLIQLTLESNSNPQQFATALQRHITSYFYRDVTLADTIADPVELYVKGKISQAPVLNEVFLVNLQDLDTIDIAMNFNEKARKLKANITAPHINYNGMELDSLSFSMDTDAENFNFDLGFNEINAGPLAIQRTVIRGNQLNNELSLDFIAFEEEDKLIQIQSRITGDRERLRFHVVPDSLIIQKNAWQTPTDNEMIITPDRLEFSNFRFSRNDQSVAITDAINKGKDQVAIDFKSFQLSEFLNYLNPEEEFAKGTMNGDLRIEDPFGSIGLVADLDIQQLSMLDVALGTLNMDANSLGGTQYDFNAAMNGGAIDMNLTGGYTASEESAQLNLDLDINEFKMKALEGFSLGALKDTDGSFSGKFDVSGTTTAPEYSGTLRFKDAGFTVTALNAPFVLADELLEIDNEGLSMNAFTIRDENDNTLVASGKIGTERFVNPTFDLTIKADDFQVLNATEKDNDFLYGKASFDADAKVTGDLQIPKVSMTLNVNDDTNVTYVMPSAAVNIEERDGVVIFVNRENPDAILTKTEEQTATVTGFDIAALLSVGKSAKVTIIIDQETGDNFEVFGEGEFDFKMKPNGRMTLAGVYEVAGGHYEMNLYNLVNRRFELAPESRVIWSGDPFDAELDVRAIYKLETSASGLMASVSSGSDPSIKNKYRQVLPFLVYLNIDGELTQPKISFALDMPEEEQGSIGGQVYGQVQQINQQESELNRQVFSLLVLNRFYPEPGSDGSRGGVASIARDNLNDALSDQLNVFSDKLLGDTGVELDFGLDSYTDYQGESPQERTQLDIAAQKKLFNDRLIVRVGSEVDIQGSSSTGEATPLVGNVSLEYLLTNNGRYRLKGFRRNEFESVIDGQTIVSGLALIFTQEFNKFDELWDALLRSETKKEQEAQKAADKAVEERAKQNEKELENKIGNE